MKSNSELALEERLKDLNDSEKYSLIKKPNFDEIKKYLEETPNSFGFLPIFSSRTGLITRALVDRVNTTSLREISELGTYRFELKYGVYDNSNCERTQFTLVIHPETLRQCESAGVIERIYARYAIKRIEETSISTDGIERIISGEERPIVTVVSSRNIDIEPQFKFEDLSNDSKGARTNFKFFRYGLRKPTQLEIESIRGIKQDLN